MAAIKHHNHLALFFAAETPDCLKFLLSFYPDKEQLDAIKSGTRYRESILYKSVKNPGALRIVLSLYPENERLKTVQAQGPRLNTVLQEAALNIESLNTLISLIPKQRHFMFFSSINLPEEKEPAKKEHQLALMQLMLSSIPESRRLDLFRFNYDLFTRALEYQDKLKIEHSFSADYLLIYSVLDNMKQGPKNSTFWNPPHPLMAWLHKTKSFDELKGIVLTQIQHNPDDKASRVLLRKLVPESASKDMDKITELKKRWNLLDSSLILNYDSPS